ncbi:MAG: reverse transcriptase-like protein [Thermoplasmata archaeon]
MRLDEVRIEDIFSRRRPGQPDSRVYRLPTGNPILVRGEADIPIEDYDTTLQTDASYFRDTKIAGYAWQLTVNGQGYAIRKKARRRDIGPNVAELRAIIYGLKEAQKRGVRRVHIVTDSLVAANLIVGFSHPRLPHMKGIMTEVQGLISNFEEVALTRTPTKDIRSVDKAARAAADERLALLNSQVLKTMEMAKSVTLQVAGDEYWADGKFRVSVDPPSCECHEWYWKWVKVPLVGKRLNRLPCQHLVKALLREGITSPEDMLEIASRARR